MIPRIIYNFWDDKENIPNVIKKCLQILKKNHVGWDIRTYDFKSLPSDLKFPKKYDQLSIQAKTDWIRLQLLKNGGIWLDISTITNKPIDTIINMESNTTQVYPSTFGGESFESWLIAAPINDIFIKKWSEHFKHAIEMGFSEYKKTIDPNWVIYDRLPYLTIFAASVKTRKELPDYPITILDSSSENYPFQLHRDCNWNANCIGSQIIKNKIKYPFIKLRGDDRFMIENFDMLGNYSNKTTFGQHPNNIVIIIILAIVFIFIIVFSIFQIKKIKNK
jgi:mannosyltransferase OCH1-like enzyme